MRRGWTLPVWALVTAAGGLLIALPDSGPALITFSSQHAPAALDAAGTALLLGGFALLLATIIPRRRALTRRLAGSPGRLATVSFLAGVGLGLLLAGVFTDFWWWWLIGAGLLQIFWLWLWREASTA